MRGRPRIAHFCAAPEFLRHILVHDLRRLRDRAEHTVLCASGHDAERVRREGFRVLTVPIERKLTPLRDLATLGVLVALLRRERFDLLHTYTPKAGLLGQIAGWAAQVPLRVHSCRGLLYAPGMPRWRRQVFRLTDRITCAGAHRVIFISNADLDLLVGEGLCAQHKAVFTGSGIDLTIFDSEQVSREEVAALRASWSAGPEHRVILTVGRYVEDKGYRELADAVPIVMRTRPDVRFVWVAPVLAGEERVLPDTYLAQRGIESQVLRLPLQERMVAVYAAADLLVHPSYREGVPRVLMEAAALGLPIIASDIPGCREVINTAELGVLAPVGRADVLAESILAALASPEAMRRRADAAGARIREEFSQDRVSGRIWEVYRELLGL